MPLSRHRRRSAARRSQRRTPAIATGGGFRSRWLLISFAAIALLFIVALLVPVVLPVNLGTGGNTGSASEYVPGIGQQVALADSREHFPDNLSITAVSPDGYLTTPPTSGRHWGAWVRCGFYTEPVPDERIVHNMEHGNIIVSYNLPDAAQVAELEDAFNDIGQTAQWGVARPYDAIPEGSVVLTTWGVMDEMTGVDADRIERFFDAYAGKLGPEFPNGAPCTSGGVMSP